LSDCQTIVLNKNILSKDMVGISLFKNRLKDLKKNILQIVQGLFRARF
jgi:hypothetical protein